MTIRERKGPLRVFFTGLALVTASLLASAAQVSAQETVQSDADGIISISRGATAVLTRPDSLRRVSIADANIADYVLFPPNQLLINGISVGSTSLVLWGAGSTPRIFTIQVTADIETLRRELRELFPDADLDIQSTGQTVILSGEVRDPAVRRKALEVAATLGVPIVDNIQAPSPEQILLHVEFAEVSRSVLKEFGTSLLQIINPARLDHAFDQDDEHAIETISGGVVTLMVAGDGASLTAVLRALKNTGEFRSLAEPNLVTIEGQTASFLAGGEFPFPTVQGGQSNSVTITWKEFGIRLNFTPNITNSGNIRLHVAPEVSSLDFANGLTFSGFQIPSILARRVETDVELRSGQTLAIGGLLDNSMLDDVDKIPLLGDIPLLGYFFRSESVRQNRTELLVLVTPYILDSNNLPAPPLPTGTPEEWDWDGHISDWIRARPDTTTGPAMGRKPGPGGAGGGNETP
jgi:pilus assembly protein CpaC